MSRLKFRLLVDYYVGGILHALLKPLTMALGWILRRDHDLRNCSEVTFVKLLGGGSLVIAYPAILALRQNPRIKKLQMLATPKTAPFGEVLGLFDEIIVISDKSLMSLAAGSLRAIWRLWRTDAVVDLEIHSRLSTVLCLMTMARNRIGAYTATSFWRRSLATHLVFFNQCGPVYVLYNQVARLFGRSPMSLGDCVEHFKKQEVGQVVALSHVDAGDMALAPLCSELSPERMLGAEEWEIVLEREFGAALPKRVHMLGGAGGQKKLEELQARLALKMPGIEWVSHGGRLSLAETVALLRKVRRLYCIDSALLHLARLAGAETVSYWGPTNPAVLLAPLAAARDRVHYGGIACSPCVHLANEAPCHGKNICMRFAAGLGEGLETEPIWLAQVPKGRGGEKREP
jgi:ADP-heptose:LPS heptosyltransferase